jgi:hypothetical protein
VEWPRHTHWDGRKACRTAAADPAPGAVLVPVLGRARTPAGADLRMPSRAGQSLMSMRRMLVLGRWSRVGGGIVFQRGCLLVLTAWCLGWTGQLGLGSRGLGFDGLG